MSLSCTTQADLCGIKWRRLTVADSYLSATREPLEDPVLTSYSKCLAADLLCVWHRVIGNKNSSSLAAGDGPGGGGGGVSGPSRTEPSPSHSTFNKELWIFWYGKEPDLSDFLSNELTGKFLTAPVCLSKAGPVNAFYIMLWRHNGLSCIHIDAYS